MTAIEFIVFRQRLIKEAYEILSRQPLKRDDRPYDPAFAQKKSNAS